MDYSPGHSSLSLWPAPTASTPVNGVVHIPGSKSMTNRALILSALAHEPSTLRGALCSRDTDLMRNALRTLGTVIDVDAQDPTALSIIPQPLHGGVVDCGLAGTVMRFLPPAGALGTGTLRIDGDPYARSRPLSTLTHALRTLGVSLDGDTLPLLIHGTGHVPGGTVEIDASASSQFVSALLLSGARFEHGVDIRHSGGRLPSIPHIDMTVAMVRHAGVDVHVYDEDGQPQRWVVVPHDIHGCEWIIEPDLSNATPFLSAALVTGGSVCIPNWPEETTQPGTHFVDIARAFGAHVERTPHGALRMTGPRDGMLRGVEVDMSASGELVPTVAALAACASEPSRITGIAHIRGHETDRLAALATEITALGGHVDELDDGIAITPTGSLHGGVWHSYADHRMATAGAIIGLVTPNIVIEDIATTSKTLPDFPDMWLTLVHPSGASHA